MSADAPPPPPVEGEPTATAPPTAVPSEKETSTSVPALLVQAAPAPPVPSTISAASAAESETPVAVPAEVDGDYDDGDYIDDDEEEPFVDDQDQQDTNIGEDCSEKTSPIDSVDKVPAQSSLVNLKQAAPISQIGRPELEDKFRPGVVQTVIEKVVREHLEGLTYDAEEMPKLVKIISEAIQHKVKAQKYERYKLVTCVGLGERRGEGISAATRCVWDSKSDCLATYTYIGETLFCCATVYGIYHY